MEMPRHRIGVKAGFDEQRLEPVGAEQVQQRSAALLKRFKPPLTQRSTPPHEPLPAEFLKMIVVHELAHLKERAHDRAFYALCRHMEAEYHQLEFDLRLWLTQVEVMGQGPWGVTG